MFESQTVAQGWLKEEVRIGVAFLDIVLTSYVLDWKLDSSELDNHRILASCLDEFRRSLCYSIKSGSQMTASL
jgi:hypothetical protein